tara:strand:+ start:219 stop:395 length:177 start_codon:yes stop_codon:yes gene_type:complete
MKAGDLVRGRSKLYFDGVGLIVKIPDGLWSHRALVRITRNGAELWMNKRELEVINESR